MSANNLPIWALYAQALGPILVTAVASIWAITIQRRMWRNAENKLKIELFERRFSLLTKINIARSKAMMIGKFTHEDLNEFDSILSEISFVFDRKTYDFIIEIRKKLVFLVVYDKETINESGSERSKLIETKYQNLDDLSDAYEKLTTLMRPSMDLSGIKI